MTDAVEFGRLIAECWSIESASSFRPENPALGQCSVTALVAHDHLGGMIVKTRVGSAWHFYNVVDGERFDFAASQFAMPVIYEDAPSGRTDALTDTSHRQYEALAKAFRRVLGPPY